MSPTTSRRERARRGLQWPVALWLTLVWVLLWGDLTLFNVLCGLVVSVVILTVFPLPPLQFGGRVRPWGLLKLIALFGFDLTRASMQVAKQAVWFGHHPHNAIIKVSLRSRGDLYFLLTSELVSLVPGSLLVETDFPNRTIFLHIIGTETLEDVENARKAALRQEARVMAALASAAEMRDYLDKVERSTS